MLDGAELDLVRVYAREIYPASRDTERFAAVALVADEMLSHVKRVRSERLKVVDIRRAVDIASRALIELEDNKK